MSTKTQDLEQVNKQIAALTQKRQNLIDAQGKAKKAIKEREAELTKELIDGKGSNTSIGFIANERVRVEGLAEAEKQIDAQLAELETERAQIEKDIAIENYEQASAEVKQKLFTCFNLLAQVGSVFGSIQIPAVPFGYSSDETALTRNMYGHLQEDFDIVRTLGEYERIAPEFMAAAKAKGLPK